MPTFNLLRARHRRLARLVALAVLSGGYLLPIAHALHRQCMSRLDLTVILITNVVYGWTGTGWLDFGYATGLRARAHRHVARPCRNGPARRPLIARHRKGKETGERRTAAARALPCRTRPAGAARALESSNASDRQP